jgi:hypothetical protein
MNEASVQLSRLFDMRYFGSLVCEEEQNAKNLYFQPLGSTSRRRSTCSCANVTREMTGTCRGFKTAAAAEIADKKW